MVYTYRCSQCDYEFDVIKSVKKFTRTERCSTCKQEALLQISSKVHFSGTKVQDAEYNPAFGKVIKNKYHRDEEAKRQNMIEVGNDFKSGESMQKHYDKVREDKRKRAWDEV
jgi:putative FmdB family regulatory protein